jgi:hypothetical protein
MNRRDAIKTMGVMGVASIGLPAIAWQCQAEPFLHIRCGNIEVSFERKDLLLTPADKYTQYSIVDIDCREEGYQLSQQYWRDAHVLSICIIGENFKDKIKPIIDCIFDAVKKFQ